MKMIRKLTGTSGSLGQQMARGITALFQGNPGTGKTMVAGVIARELGAVWAGDAGTAPPRPLDAALIFAGRAVVLELPSPAGRESRGPRSGRRG